MRFKVNTQVMPVPFIADHFPVVANVTADALSRMRMPNSQYSLPQILRDVPQAPIVAGTHVGTLQLPPSGTREQVGAVFAFVKTELPEATTPHGSLFPSGEGEVP